MSTPSTPSTDDSTAPPGAPTGRRRGGRRGGRRRLRASRGRFVALEVAALLVIAVVLGGPYVYARFLAPEPPPPLGATAPADAGRASSEVPADGELPLDGEWQVAEGSQAGYRLDEVLSGQPVTVVGRTGEITGSLTVRDGALVATEVVVDVASIETDESARDAYFRRALRVSSVPEARFTLTEPVDLGALAEEGSLVVDAVGELELNDAARPVVVSLEVRRSVDGADAVDAVEVVGSIPVVLADHGLTAPDLGFVTVEPEGVVEMLLRLRR